MALSSKVRLHLILIVVAMILIGGCGNKSTQNDNEQNNESIGDINLNGIAFEIADAVLYVNYFVYGIDVLTVNSLDQIAASDVNTDGIPLTVSDLVYHIRHLTGDALSIPVVVTTKNVGFANNNGTLAVSGDFPIGAALAVIEGNVTPVLLADNMEMIFVFDGQETRVLVYSLGGGSFIGDFLSVSGTIKSIEMATYEGNPVVVGNDGPLASLLQNDPNPFSTSTTIAFALPIASDYLLQIFENNYTEIKRYAGYAEAGITEIVWDASQYPSANYNYRLTVGTYSVEKTMTLSP